MLSAGRDVNRRLIKIGSIGGLITALCCFTPVLVWLAAALGLSAVLGVVDRVLLPALGLFVLILLAGLLHRAGR